MGPLFADNSEIADALFCELMRDMNTKNGAKVNCYVNLSNMLVRDLVVKYGGVVEIKATGVQLFTDYEVKFDGDKVVCFSDVDVSIV